jgi:hypothetical protein
MGDPAEENDPPPESKGFLTKGFESVNWKSEKTLGAIAYAGIDMSVSW